MQHGYDSSSNSNSSSISSLSASSSDSDLKTAGPSELEADADSLTCRQSVVSSGDQLESDGPKLVLHLYVWKSTFGYYCALVIGFLWMVILAVRIQIRNVAVFESFLIKSIYSCLNKLIVVCAGF